MQSGISLLATEITYTVGSVRLSLHMFLFKKCIIWIKLYSFGPLTRKDLRDGTC